LFLAVMVCFALRIVLRPMDEGSFLARLYVGFFRALNLLLPWYRLPTWVGIMNLGALREVLRTKNLTGTDDIPVTDAHGRTPAPPRDQPPPPGPRHLQGGRHPELPGGGLDPVRDARLVLSRQPRQGERVPAPAEAGRRLGSPGRQDADPPHPAGPDPGLRRRAPAGRTAGGAAQAAPAHLRQRRLALVGRVPDLRRRRGHRPALAGRP